MTSPPSVAARSLWKLGGLTPGNWGRAVFEEIDASNVFGRAAELAFYFLFALFPLIFLMMTLFGLFASHSVELRNEFLSYFADFLPPTAFQLLRGVTTEIAAHASQGKTDFWRSFSPMVCLQLRKFNDLLPESWRFMSARLVPGSKLAQSHSYWSSSLTSASYGLVYGACR